MAGDLKGDLLPPATRPPSADGDAFSAGPGGTAASPRRRSGRRRLLAWFVVIPMAVATLLGIGAGVAAWRLQHAVDRKISRFGDPFAQLPAGTRPIETVTPTTPSTALDLLVIGSDSRISAGDPTQWEAGAQRTDALMLVHIPADRSGVFVVSIPRDAWVTIPGHGAAKINAAFSWGGPALTIATVERLTGVKIDHIVVTDFTGFARITDLLGGVTITVPQKTRLGNGDQTIAAGTHHLDGQTALAYVRERYTLPAGDLDRVKRQQNWIRAILRGAATSGVQTDPQRLLLLVDALATHVSTDSGFTIQEMRDLVLSLRHVGSGGARFLTVPVAGTGWSPDGKQSIVELDTARADTLWKAVARDKVATWLSDHPRTALGESVR